MGSSWRLATSVPFTWGVSTMAFYREDRPVPKPGEFPEANSHFASPDYFRTMGIPLVRGRGFTGVEPQPPLPAGATLTPDKLAEYYQGVIIESLVSQRMADKYWPGEDPVGKTFRLGYPDMKLPLVRIVGIVGATVQEGLDQEKPAEFYAPVRQFPMPFGLHLVVRSKRDGAGLLAAVRRCVQTVSKEPVKDIQPMLARIEGSLAGRRFNTRLLLAFSATALGLALIGVYGVMAFVVGRRTREVAVRMALGARRGEVLGAFLWRGRAWRWRVRAWAWQECGRPAACSNTNYTA